MILLFVFLGNYFILVLKTVLNSQFNIVNNHKSEQCALTAQARFVLFYLLLSKSDAINLNF